MAILSAVELPDLLFGPSVDDLVHALFVTPHAPCDGLNISEIDQIADVHEADICDELIACEEGAQ